MEKSKYDMEKIKKILTDKSDKMQILMDKCDKELDKKPEDEYFTDKSQTLAIMILNIQMTLFMIEDKDDIDDIILFMNKKKVKLSDKDIPEVNFTKTKAKKEVDIAKLTDEEKKALKKKIPLKTYDAVQKKAIEGFIMSNDIKEVKDFPTSTKKVAGPRGGTRATAGRKEAVDKDKKKASREATKAINQAAKAKAKELERINKQKPYYKAGEVPKGFRPASMQEAMENGKIMLWGEKKVDNKIIQSLNKKDSGSSIVIEMARLSGKILRLKNNIKYAKTLEETKTYEAELEQAKKQMLVKKPLFDKYQAEQQRLLKEKMNE